MPNSLAPKLLAEFIGTFTLIFIGAGAGAVGRRRCGPQRYHRGCPRPRFDRHGLRLCVRLRVGRAILNPCVTLGCSLPAPCARGEAAGYIVIQLIGGYRWRALLVGRTGRRADRPRHADACAQCLHRRHVPDDNAGCRLHNRSFARLFPGHGGPQHGRCGPRRQPRTAGDRNDADPQHPHGRGPSRAPPSTRRGLLAQWFATGNFSDAWLYLTAPIVGAIVAVFMHTGLVRLAQERMAAEPDRAARTPAE